MFHETHAFQCVFTLGNRWLVSSKYVVRFENTREK
jgi:hypothetical protein